MRKVFMLVILLFVWVLLLSQPIISFEKLKYDFGEIKEEAGPHEYSFKYVNDGDEVFQITNVKPG